MGVKHFFYWFRKNFKSCILERFCTSSQDLGIDNLLIDLNGNIHNATQYWFKYGKYKNTVKNFMVKNKVESESFKESKTFEEICKTIEKTYLKIRPKKRLVICIDGVAPRSKQNQQRQRRFRKSHENKTENGFDSNCISPGTVFMHKLSRYIDIFLRRKLTEDVRWKNIEVIFSNEKVCGEGEHKLFNYIRKFSALREIQCICGVDADLILIILSNKFENFWIYREDMYEYGKYFMVDMKKSRLELVKLLKWGGDFDRDTALQDFVLMSFLTGNDFLPHIQGIEIIENGLEIMIDVYKNVCSNYGHLTENGKIRKRVLQVFFGTISQYIKGIFENKLLKKGDFFPDPMLEECASFREGSYTVDINKYRIDFYKDSFPNTMRKDDLCHKFLEGMQWVLSYYEKGVPNWNWFFPYHYAPMAIDIAKHIESYETPEFYLGRPFSPFEQLLSILPPQSCLLLPKCLGDLLKSEDFKRFCPGKIEVDLSGKRQEWEGLVLLPFIHTEFVKKQFRDTKDQIEKSSFKLNIRGKNFVYKRTSQYPIKIGKLHFLCKYEPKFIDF